jgi:hypothetical protein
MSDNAMILGLKKSAVVLHALAFSFEREDTKKETLALVEAINMAVKKLENKND